MMYHMKNIINHNDAELSLPKCMYRIKNPIDFSKADEIDININQQVIKLLKAPNPKMAELEQRQDLLLKKLDILYDRIKTISSYCSVQVQNGLQSKTVAEKKNTVPFPEEIILVFSPDNLPWFLNILLSQASFAVNGTWHIHSSVPKEKVQKIMTFVQKLKLNNGDANSLHLRLIFKNVSVDSELILSSLAVPIVGNVNILRYLSYLYPNVIIHDFENHCIDGLMDICHILERTSEKNKEALINKLFSQCKNWIYNNNFSIVDLAAYNVIKQWRNVPKSVPKNWFENCNKFCA